VEEDPKSTACSISLTNKKRERDQKEGGRTRAISHGAEERKKKKGAACLELAKRRERKRGETGRLPSSKPFQRSTSRNSLLEALEKRKRNGGRVASYFKKERGGARSPPSTKNEERGKGAIPSTTPSARKKSERLGKQKGENRKIFLAGRVLIEA